MAESSRRRNLLIALAVLVIVILLLLGRCMLEKPAPARDAGTPPSVPGSAAREAPPTGEPGAREPDEVLSAAKLRAPERVAAGAAFSVDWTGPDNRGDYVTIVRTEAPADAHSNYRETSHGKSLELTAPTEPGAHEVRYVTGRSRTILARVPVEVIAVGATLDAAANVTLGAKFPVAWTGPNNKGDYITIVPKGAPDEQYGDYANTDKGPPLTLTAPNVPGDAELRYVIGEGRKVLARRPIRVVAPEVALSAPAEAIAGTTIEVAWTGPNNAGDYITLVASETPEGQYGNYTNTSQGSPLKLLTPIIAGSAELRYMTGEGRRVLGRRPIKIAAAAVTLSAPAQCAPGAAVSITWTGPNNPGDYVTVVPKGTPDGQYGAYTNTSKGSPLSVTAPTKAGDAEIRYQAGQGNKVLARIPLKVVP